LYCPKAAGPKEPALLIKRITKKEKTIPKKRETDKKKVFKAIFLADKKTRPRIYL